MNNSQKFEVSWLSDDTIYFKYSENVVVDVDDIKEMLTIQSQMGVNENTNRIIHAGQYTSITPKAREYIKKNKPKAKSEAFILPSLSHRILFNFYQKFRSKENPIKSFRELAPAVEWINDMERNRKGY